MGKINVLDKHIAELIAAGEVVERPASVIKELAENSVDAGASAVAIEIKNGGKTFIRVTDDGCGIARTDVPAAFMRHATSKISKRDDLENIGTLGFRGEALASIAAVSHVELITRTRDELAGTRFFINGGDAGKCEDAGCASGTTIVVRDIFYNTPARMKFLKKDVTESNAVAGVADKIALSHPEVSFRFLRDGRETLHTPGDGRIKSAVFAVYGREFTAGLIPADYELDGVKVSGFVCKPSAARPNRSMQNFFINGRYVKSRTVAVALEEAYKGSIMVGKVPSCAIYIEIPYGTVDVNVHPSKMEVRFINEKPIFSAVYHAVKTALNEDGVQSAPAKTVEITPEPKLPEKPVEAKTSFSYTPVQMDFKKQAAPVPSPRYAVSDNLLTDAENAAAKEFVFNANRPDGNKTAGTGDDEEPCAAAKEENLEESAGESQKELERGSEEPQKLIGEAFGTYIILERGDKLIVIDKHAAHERILYEKLKRESGEQFTQMLLEPVTVTLDKNEYSAALDSIDIYAKAGFEIEDFGSGTVIVRGAPMILGGDDIRDAVIEIAGYLVLNKSDVTTSKVEWIYHNVACRAAVKAGDRMSDEELTAIADKVESDDVRYCPHGRPVRLVFERKDIERRFGRIQ